MLNRHLFVKLQNISHKALFNRRPCIDIVFTRVILYGFFIWKLLSRDYRIFAFADEDTLSVFSAITFQDWQGYTTFARTPFVELATFHWIHWFVSFPDYNTLSAIYLCTMLLCGFIIIGGSGYRNSCGVGAFVLLNYLWGYNWRTGADVDAVFIPLQIALLFCLYPGWNGPVWGLNKTLFGKSREAGWFSSMCILIFCGYYGLSGINKLIDISLYEWIACNVIEHMEQMYYYKTLGDGILFINPWPYYITKGHYWLDSVIVSLTYLSHLSIIIMFFNRRFVSSYMMFYWVFHFMNTGLAIWFSGLLVIWLIFVPYHRLFSSVTIAIAGHAPCTDRLARILAALNWLKHAHITTVNDTGPESPRVAGIKCSEDSTDEEYIGGYAIRRLVWGFPGLWIFLPIVYVPFVAGLLHSCFVRLALPLRSSKAPCIGTIHYPQQGVAIVYDGECPFCRNYVTSVRLKQSVGKVTLLDVRLDNEIAQRMFEIGLDIDKGMVAIYQDKYYYGSACIHFLGLLTTPSTWFNRINAFSFRSSVVSALLYPVLRLGRNAVLVMLGRPHLKQYH